MIPHISDNPDIHSIPIVIVQLSGFDTWLTSQDPKMQNWLAAQGFIAKKGNFETLPGADGTLSSVIFIVEGSEWDIWTLAGLPANLPSGQYELKAELNEKQATDVVIGWSLATYQFDRYKKSDKKFATLLMPETTDKAHVERTVYATNLARELVNIPTADMGPKALEGAASQIAGEFEARQMNVVGEDLLTYHFPMVHAVGRASTQAPRLIDMVWGDPEAPKVTIVGKGVCFDTGGLDLKSSAGMLLMKKDMGGAAIALSLAHMIMHANLPVRLRVLVPAVENSVSGNAFRPGDILTSRNG